MTERLDTGVMQQAMANYNSQGYAVFKEVLDTELIKGSVERTGMILTVEDNALQGGFGSAVLEFLSDAHIKADVKRLGVPDSFVQHGTQDELKRELGLDAEGIEAAVKSLIEGHRKHNKNIA